MRQFRRQVHRRARWLMARILEDRLEEQPPLRRDGFPARAEHQAVAGNAPRHPVDPLDRIGALRNGRIRTSCTPWAGSARRTSTGSCRRTSFCCGCATNCTSTPGRRPTCSIGPSSSASPSCAATGPRPDCCRSSSSCGIIFATPTPSATLPRDLSAKAQSHDRMARLVTVLFGHRVEDGFTSARRACWPRGAACELLRGDLTAIMRLVDLANLYDKPIAAATWEAIRREALPAAARRCRRRRPAATSSRC